MSGTFDIIEHSANFGRDATKEIALGAEQHAQQAKAESDSLLLSIQDLTEVVSGKANAADVTTALAGKADVAATLSGYGIADAYTKSETDARIQNVIGTAPAALDTLGEIATQLQNDESAASALTITVSQKANTSDVNTALAGKEATVAAGTTGDYYRGDKTWVNLASAVLNVVLAGLSTATSSPIVSTDNILAAFGKLQAQIDSHTTSISTLNTTVAGKENTIAAGTSTQYYRGDKTWQTLSSAVLGVVLAGLSTATNAVVTATDTVLQSIGKLQAQITSLTTTVSNKADTTTVNTGLAGKENTITAGTALQFWRGDKTWTDFATTVRATVLTGLSTATNAAIVATDSVIVALGKLQAQMSAFTTYVDTAITNERSAAATLTNKTLVSPTITNYTETLYAATANGALTVDLANGTLQKITLTANSTITLPTSVEGKSYTIIIAYSGAFVPTFAGGSTLKWANGSAPPAKSTSGYMDIFVFTCDGTNTLGRSGGSSF